MLQSPTACPACGTRGHLGKLENEENRTVKRTVGILAGMATLGIGVYLGSQVWAQQGAGQGAAVSREPLKTRIAVVNLRQVLKNYKKFKNAQDDIKKQIEQAQKEFKPLEDQVNVKQARRNVPDISNADRAEIEREPKRWFTACEAQKEE